MTGQPANRRVQSVVLGKVQLPCKETVESMEADIAFVNAWCKRRYSVMGGSGNWLAFEMMGYLDTLCDDMGLKVHKSRGSWDWWFRPALRGDFEGALDEWRGIVAAREEGELDLSKKEI